MLILSIGSSIDKNMVLYFSFKSKFYIIISFILSTQIKYICYNINRNLIKSSGGTGPMKLQQPIRLGAKAE